MICGLVCVDYLESFNGGCVVVVIGKYERSSACFETRVYPDEVHIINSGHLLNYL